MNDQQLKDLLTLQQTFNHRTCDRLDMLEHRIQQLEKLVERHSHYKFESDGRMELKP